MSFGLQNNDATTYRLLVTSTPEKIDEAIEAGVRVLRGFKLQRVSQREVDRARLTLLATRDGFKDERVLGRFDAVYEHA